MNFASIRFLIFFPSVFFLYYAFPHRARKYLLLIASYYFYMCWKPEFIVLIIVSTCIDYFCGLGIEKRRDDRRAAKTVLAISMCTNLGLLFFFKYFNFFGETLNALCRAVSIPFSVPALNIILPVGISFYTFQTMSYTIDVYRGKMPAEQDFVTFALFVSFFPQLVAGPIEKATNLLPQLKQEHSFNYDNATYGLKLMAWGFFKKLVVADRLAALLVDPIYGNLENYSGGALALATAAFAFQIYCDFSGYSDIARGCAKTMGIDLMVNFKQPYLALSLTDFWKRWHISLTSWFRDYVYIPLGGSRKGAGKRAIFVTMTFFLSGLWHGAGWTFVIWGLLQAVYLNIEYLLGVGKRPAPKCRSLAICLNMVSWMITYILCCFSWVFFRADTMADALYVVCHCLDGLSAPLHYIKTTYLSVVTGEIPFGLSALSLLILFLFDVANEKRDVILVISAWPTLLRWTVYVVFILVLLLLIPREGTTPFIYFQF